MSEWIKENYLVDIKIIYEWKIARIKRLLPDSADIVLDDDENYKKNIDIKFIAKLRSNSSLSALSHFSSQFTYWRLNFIETSLKSSYHEFCSQSAEDFCQFFKGHLPVFIYSLLKSEIVDLLAYKERIFNLFFKILDIFLNFLQNFSIILVNDARQNFIFTVWPEILDLTEIILGKEEFFKNFYEICQYIPENFISVSQHEKVSIFQSVFIDYFIKNQGLESLIQIFDSIKEININASIVFSINLKFYNEILDKDVIQAFCERIYDKFIFIIERFDESCLRSEDYLKIFKNFRVLIENLPDYGRILHTSYLDVVIRAFFSGSLEKRIRGIVELSELIERENRFISDFDLAEFIVQRGISDDILQKRIHVQILKKADKVFTFLAKLGKLDERMLGLIQSFENNMEKEASETFNFIYKAMYPYLNINQKKMFKGNFVFFREEDEGRVFDKELFAECFKDFKDYISCMKGIKTIVDIMISDEILRESFFSVYEEGLNDINLSFHYIKIMCSILENTETSQLIQIKNRLSLYTSTIESLSTYLKFIPSQNNSPQIPYTEQLKSRFSLLSLLCKKSNQSLSKKSTRAFFTLFLTIQDDNFRSQFQKFLKLNPSIYKAEVLIPFFSNPLFESTYSIDSFKIFKNIFFQVNSNTNLLINHNKFQYILNFPINSLDILFKLLYISKKSVLGKIKVLIRNVLSCYSFGIIESIYEILNKNLALLKSFHDPDKPEEVYLFVSIIHDILFGSNESKSGSVVRVVLVLNSFKEYYSVYEIIDVFSVRKYICARIGNDLADVAFRFKGKVYNCLNNNAVIKLENEDQIFFLPQEEFLDISGKGYLVNCLKDDLEEYWKLAASNEKYAKIAFNIAKALGCCDILTVKVVNFEISESDLSSENKTLSIQIPFLLYSNLNNENFIRSAKSSENLKIILKGMSELSSISQLHVDILIYCLQFTRYTLSLENTDIDSVFSIFYNIFIWLVQNLNSARFLEIYNIFCESFSLLFKTFSENDFILKSREILIQSSFMILQKFNEIDQENSQISDFGDYIRYLLYISDQTNNFLNLIISNSLNLIQQPRFTGILLILSKILENSRDSNTKQKIIHQILLETLKNMSESHTQQHKNMIFTLQLLTTHANLINELDIRSFYSEYLLRLPDSTSSPKCKFNSTRVQCFNFVLKIIEIHSYFQSNFINSINSLIINKSWRTLKPKDWNINIESDHRLEIKFVGIKNPSCICYSNSLIQQLFHIHAFTEFVLYGIDPETCPLIDCLKGMFGKLKFGYKQVISGKKIVREVNASEVYNEQKDAEEFLNNLFMKLMSSKSDQAAQLITKLFSFTQIQEIKSQDCPHTQTKEESFTSLNIELNSDSLLTSLQKSFTSEMLQHENAYECQQCNKKVSATRKQSFLNLPNYLILVLKRFSYDASTGMRIKLNDRFVYGEKLDLSAFLHEKLSDLTQNFTFSLKGITLHSGNTDHGHYFSYIKTESGQWFEFNDATVEPIKKEAVFYKAFGGKNDCNSPSAYLLIYEKEKIDFSTLWDQDIEKNDEKMRQFDWIDRKNHEIKIKEIVFSDNFLELFEKIIEFPAAGVFCVEYFLACFIRMRLKADYVFKIYKKLYVHLQVQAVEHLLQMITDFYGCFEFVIFNSNSESRKLISLLLKKFLNEFSSDFLFLSASKLMINLVHLHKNKTDAPESFYEILGILIRPIEDFCRKQKIVEVYISIIFKNYPMMETIESSSNLKVISREHYSNIPNTMKPERFSVTFLILFLADNLHLLNERDKESLCVERNMFYLFNNCNKKQEFVALSLLYSNIYEPDPDGAYNYMIQLLQCSFEQNPKYLTLMSLFLRKYSKRIQILQLFLENYIELINPELNEWSCVMIKYLVKFFQITNMDELSQYLAESRIQLIKHLVLSYLQLSPNSYQLNKIRRLYEIFTSNEDVRLQDSDDEIDVNLLQPEKIIFICDQSPSIQAIIKDSIENEIILMQPVDNKSSKLLDKSKFECLQVSFHHN